VVIAAGGPALRPPSPVLRRAASVEIPAGDLVVPLERLLGWLGRKWTSTVVSPVIQFRETTKHGAVNLTRMALWPVFERFATWLEAELTTGLLIAFLAVMLLGLLVL